MTEERDIEEDLKFSPKDGIYQGVKGGLSAIPFIGGPVTNIIANVLPSPLEKRKTKWFTSFDQRLQRLEKADERFKPEALMENEIFISMFIHATNIAMRTHQEEKLEALRNAVIHSAINPTVDENIQLMFLNLIDRYTPVHFQLLHFFDVSTRKIKNRPHNVQDAISDIIDGDVVEVGEALEKTFPELQGKEAFYDQIIRNLMTDGLFKTVSLSETILTSLTMENFTLSDFGIQFINFIMNPASSNEFETPL